VKFEALDLLADGDEAFRQIYGAPHRLPDQVFLNVLIGPGPLFPGGGPAYPYISKRLCPTVASTIFYILFKGPLLLLDRRFRPRSRRAFPSPLAFSAESAKGCLQVVKTAFLWYSLLDFRVLARRRA
jgi:hypothetical protein